MKALVIDEPWIGKILRGEKTWEMRKTSCHHRGRIALIRKGSGLVVGTADVVDSMPPIETTQAYADAEPFHRVPPDRQERAFADGWARPWVLADARPLSPAVRYAHPSGAVIWVNLDQAVAAAISAQVGSTAQATSEAAKISAPIGHHAEPERAQARTTPVLSAPAGHAPSLSGETARRIVVTGGNIRNTHIYLPLDFFPDDAIGGRNKMEAAARTISVTFKPGVTVETDIDGAKRILRTRGPIGDFLTRAGVEEGDAVVITRTSPYAYTISKAPNA